MAKKLMPKIRQDSFAIHFCKPSMHRTAAKKFGNGVSPAKESG